MNEDEATFAWFETRSIPTRAFAHPIVLETVLRDPDTISVTIDGLEVAVVIREDGERNYDFARRCRTYLGLIDRVLERIGGMTLSSRPAPIFTTPTPGDDAKEIVPNLNLFQIHDERIFSQTMAPHPLAGKQEPS